MKVVLPCLEIDARFKTYIRIIQLQSVLLVYHMHVQCILYRAFSNSFYRIKCLSVTLFVSALVLFQFVGRGSVCRALPGG